MTDILKDASPRPWLVKHESIGSTQAGRDAIPLYSGWISEAWAGEDATPESKANAKLIVTAVNAYEPMLAALEACRAWHYAEEKSLGDFYVRGDLCAYSEHLTKIALGMKSEFTAPPKMIVWPEVELQRSQSVTIAECVSQLIEHERAAIHQAKGKTQ